LASTLDLTTTISDAEQRIMTEPATLTEPMLLLHGRS
jgi:hypothetical protein